jgi:hypothetical protein
VPLLIEESTRVGASPEAIWKLLSEPKSWSYWWHGCKQAESADRHPLRDGSSFALTLELGPFPITVRPTVEVAQPNRALVWTVRSMGVTQRHAFYIEIGSQAVMVRRRATFEGWGMFLFRLLGLPAATAVMFRKSLSGLRKAAERS